MDQESKTSGCGKALKQTECAVCLDEHLRYEIVDMVCEHVFCTDCFNGKLRESLLCIRSNLDTEGWNVVQASKEPFECCNHRIPLKLSQIYIRLDEDQAKAYKRFLIERDTLQPVFCPRPDCTGFLGAILQLAKDQDRNSQCPECAFYFCIMCSATAHGGRCDPEELEGLMGIGLCRCPNCGYATMEDGGCSHI